MKILLDESRRLMMQDRSQSIATRLS
jgi:hypothetical protein